MKKKYKSLENEHTKTMHEAENDAPVGSPINRLRGLQNKICERS